MGEILDNWDGDFSVNVDDANKFLNDEILSVIGDDTVHINLWDDYYEEGYIPEGKIQETFMYVESDQSDEVHEHVLKIVLSYMILQNIEGVEYDLIMYDSRDYFDALDELYQYSRWQIMIKHLTHAEREKLIEKMNNITSDKIYFDSSS